MCIRDRYCYYTYVPVLEQTQTKTDSKRRRPREETVSTRAAAAAVLDDNEESDDDVQLVPVAVSVAPAITVRVRRMGPQRRRPSDRPTHCLYIILDGVPFRPETTICHGRHVTDMA